MEKELALKVCFSLSPFKKIFFFKKKKFFFYSKTERTTNPKKKSGPCLSHFPFCDAKKSDTSAIDLQMCKTMFTHRVCIQSSSFLPR